MKKFQYVEWDISLGKLDLIYNFLEYLYICMVYLKNQPADW